MIPKTPSSWSIIWSAMPASSAGQSSVYGSGVGEGIDVGDGTGVLVAVGSGVGDLPIGIGVFSAGTVVELSAWETSPIPLLLPAVPHAASTVASVTSTATIAGTDRNVVRR